MDWSWIRELIGGIGQLGNLGLNAYGMFNKPKMPSYTPPPPQPQPMPMFEMPDMGPWFEAMNQQMMAQQQMQQQMMTEFMNQPPPQAPPPDYKSIARGYLGTKNNMAERGLYSGGAVTPEALAAIMGIDDPQLIYDALKNQGLTV